MKLVLNFVGNQGYGSDQVTGNTLAELRSAVDTAIATYGPDAEFVLLQNTMRAGAHYGALLIGDGPAFTPATDEDD